jgi:hypothetical protein
VALVYSGVTLPVEILAFKAKKRNKNILLSWQTAMESLNSHFEIEWSHNASTFKKIGEVAGSVTASEILFYDFLHKNPANGINFYRLRQIDFNGASDYSEIISIDFDNANIHVKYYPNPAKDFIIVEGLEEGKMVHIFNLNGNEVKAFQIRSPIHQISVSDLPKGTYFIKAGQVFKKLLIQQ